jgi:inner membrane protein
VNSLLYKTHFLGGVVAGLLVAGTSNSATALLCAGAAGIAALLPDLDTPQSELGRHLKLISIPTRAIFHHRGALHSLLAACALAVLFFMVIQHHQFYDLCFEVLASTVAGYLSHLVLDSFNPEGVRWLWPAEIRFKLPLVKTGSILEYLVVTPALFIWVVCLVWPMIHHLI